MKKLQSLLITLALLMTLIFVNACADEKDSVHPNKITTDIENDEGLQNRAAALINDEVWEAKNKYSATPLKLDLTHEDTLVIHLCGTMQEGNLASQKVEINICLPHKKITSFTNLNALQNQTFTLRDFGYAEIISPVYHLKNGEGIISFTRIEKRNSTAEVNDATSTDSLAIIITGSFELDFYRSNNRSLHIDQGYFNFEDHIDISDSDTGLPANKMKS